MKNNGISAVIVDHFIMKKGTIRHIFLICDTEVLKIFTQSEKHTSNTITNFHGKQIGTKRVELKINDTPL